MKKQLSALIISLLMINTLTSQIKIGDNPQNIHPASVLELESPSRVLVITRVTDAQMNNINPLRGAIVYNTDQECLHYYDGNEWINICEAFNNTFTLSTNAVFNPFSRDSTVVITQDDTNYNFEVNQITGDNIVDTSINGANEIQQGSITGPLLSNATISFDKLADGGNTGDLLRWNGAQWVLENEGVINITEKDSIIGNEVLDATAGGALERFGLGTDVSPFTLDVRDGGIENTELGADAVTSDKIFNGTIINEDLADDAITSEKILNGEVDTQDIADQAITINKMGLGSVGTNQIVDDAVTRVKLENGVNVGDLMRWDGANWVLINETALNITENDGDPNNELTDLNLDASNILTLTNPASPGNQIDLSAYVNDDNNELSDVQLTGTTLELTNAAAGATGVNLDTVFATDAELTAASDDDITGASLDAPSNVLTISEGTTDVFVDLSDLDDSAGVTTNATNLANHIAADGDTDDTNELSDVQLTGTTLELTNAAAGATGVNLDTVFATDAELTAASDDDITGASLDAPSNVLTISEGATDVFVDLSDLDDSAGVTTNATNLANHIAADGDTDDANELSDVQLTGTTLELTNAAAGATGVNLDTVFATDAELTAASDDDITGASLDAPSNVLTISEGATDVFVDLSDLDDSAGVTTNATNLANHIAADGDTDDTNELSDVQLTGTTLELTNAAVGATGANLSSLNESVSPGTGISVNNVGEDFEVAVTNPVIAMGRVTGGVGTPVGSAVVNNTGGSYTVTLTSTPANYVVQLTINSPAGTVRTIQVTSQLAAAFDIQIYDELGSPSDADWYYTVTSF